MQNNSTAAINSLRRIGARRTEARDETQHIEKRLASIFKEPGFHVCLNYQPARTIEDDPGEADLVCTRDTYVLVLELHEGNLAGYKFKLVGDAEDDLFILLGKLIQRIRKALSARHIKDGDYGLQVVDETVRG